MRVLWLCNIILPSIAPVLNLKASNKEGWLSGICDAVKVNHDFELGVCFPVPYEMDGFEDRIDGISYYGFYEDTAHPEVYDESLEKRLSKIADNFFPDVIHIFGTEYPHTLAMCRSMKNNPEKLLIGIQGILDIYKNHFFDGVPDYVVNRKTLRDILRKDDLKIQQNKFALRAVNEVEAVEITGNVTGRTPFDLEFCAKVNPDAKYHFMNETLRGEFYDGRWDISKCEKHSVFLSQGNYPIKGLHVFLQAFARILEKYPDAKAYVAGDKITCMETLKDKIKIGSYGKYIRELLDKYKLEDSVIFTGNITASEIKERLLAANLFVCPSTIENSPNSLGEAMLLGVPCIASRVGGISGIFKENSDGFMFDNTDSDGLYECIDRLFADEGLQLEFSEKASMHAHITHNPEINYKRLLEIYREIKGN